MFEVPVSKKKLCNFLIYNFKEYYTRFLTPEEE